MFAHKSADQSGGASPATVMPPEWAPHERTWMAFPPANDTFGRPGSDTLERARRAWATVARTIARHEPVTVAVAPEDAEAARALLGGGIETAVMPLDDAWMRDIGLTFVHGPGGEVWGVDWVFNGWGAQGWAAWESDRLVGGRMAELAGVRRMPSTLVNEGGGFHVDGSGTVLLTETVQLDPGRNPDLGKAEVEAEIHARLGTAHAVWLPRGLTRDYDEFGTRGHVDIVAAFTEAGTVLLHRQHDPRHPDHQVTRGLREVLEQAVGAEGEPLRIVDVPAPEQIRDEDGEFVDWSYINHYVANGVVVLCAFDDPQDEVAAGILAEAYPGRRIELVDARDIFLFGGGIHCITQQQPAPRAQWRTL
ncbi:agmatine deiminase family protein [Nocardiopsis metallicus]|uniref:Agmatine deiminase n=1 Tax=Nocardiopsis metallicus TaxID=179819 RepID=A0A840WAF6_9ACTN|nr:agmatine deiminase family protein [Nocardiopsis metallicus]MBB5490021.1 agmatine deiminase [Nocardiopsis metallicus]